MANKKLNQFQTFDGREFILFRNGHEYWRNAVPFRGVKYISLRPKNGAYRVRKTGLTVPPIHTLPMAT